MTITKLAQGIALALTITVAAAGTLSAKDGMEKGGRKGRGKGMIERIIRKLDITPEQQARIKAIRQEFKTENAGLMAELKTAHKQIRDAAKGGDRESAREILDETKAKRERMKAAREEMRQQMLAVLTAEQRAEIETMRAERKERKEKKGGRENGRKGKASSGGLHID